MIEKPKRPKKIPNQDNKQPQTIQELIRRYDLDNTKIYDFLDELVGHLKQTQTVVSATEPTGDNREKVWIQKGKNKFNRVNATNEWLGIDGKTGTSAVTARTGKIKIEANKYYMFSYDYDSLANENQRVFCIYNSDFTLLQGYYYDAGKKQISIKLSDDGYIDIAYDINCKNIMLEQNSIVTDYEEYIEQKMFVKNDNDVYEEFIKKEEIIETNIASTATSYVTNITRAIIRSYGRVHHIDIACSVTQGQVTLFNTHLKPAFTTELNLATNSKISTRCVINTAGGIEVPVISSTTEVIYINGIVIV